MSDVRPCAIACDGQKLARVRCARCGLNRMAWGKQAKSVKCDGFVPDHPGADLERWKRLGADRTEMTRRDVTVHNGLVTHHNAPVTHRWDIAEADTDKNPRHVGGFTEDVSYRETGRTNRRRRASDNSVALGDEVALP